MPTTSSPSLEVSSGESGGKGRSCALRSRSLPTCDVNLESRRHLKTRAMWRRCFHHLRWHCPGRPAHARAHRSSELAIRPARFRSCVESDGYNYFRSLGLCTDLFLHWLRRMRFRDQSVLVLHVVRAQCAWNCQRRSSWMKKFGRWCHADLHDASTLQSHV